MSTSLRADGSRKTAIVTGGAGGIGAQTIREFYHNGFNVVIADLSFAQRAAEEIIKSFPDPSRAIFHSTNIVNWEDMKSLFRTTKQKFGQVDVVVANAGIMESREFYEFEEDENGELKELVDASRVIDINLKGTMNTLRLALHSMKSNPVDSDGARGSVILIASTSGYFGGTGVVAYVSSKHGVVGLARSSQRVAAQSSIRLNVVAPFFTPTHITGSYSAQWKERGLPANTVEDVATAIVQTSTDPQRKGHSVMVAGKMVREIETTRTGLTTQWLGEEIAHVMAEGGKFFDDIGGYPLPKARA
ncbi:NAD(P)-binding protein [Aaosphaeria arxii CBS 175.79]|uniref:NAD(P)-binding protein n=1 Tax=Aaosphaeria arxii CBS 175.79 TaxID=1450172 RepID=A0A6A5YAY3_9PLEO|nr:NAD(P)-binding protein [Aaosphaeria arxii CBS 175.79]KAF2022396.1 NAD(P)-binding protein [Aaosphaeria arxii CBS 175.79]